MILFLVASVISVKVCLTDGKRNCPSGYNITKSVEELMDFLEDAESDTCVVALFYNSTVDMSFDTLTCENLTIQGDGKVNLALHFKQKNPPILELTNLNASGTTFAKDSFDYLSLNNVTRLEINELQSYTLKSDYKSLSNVTRVGTQDLILESGMPLNKVTVRRLAYGSMKVNFSGFTNQTTLVLDEMMGAGISRFTSNQNENNSIILFGLNSQDTVYVNSLSVFDIKPQDYISSVSTPVFHINMTMGDVIFNHSWPVFADSRSVIVCHFCNSSEGRVVIARNAPSLTIEVSEQSVGNVSRIHTTDELCINEIHIHNKGSLILTSPLTGVVTTLAVNMMYASGTAALEVEYAQLRVAVDNVYVSHGGLTVVGPGEIYVKNGIYLEFGSIMTEKLTLSPLFSYVYATMSLTDRSWIFVSGSLNIEGDGLELEWEYFGKMPSDDVVKKVIANGKQPLIVAPLETLTGKQLSWHFSDENTVAGFTNSTTVVVPAVWNYTEFLYCGFSVVDYPSSVFRKACMWVTDPKLCDRYDERVPFSPQNESLFNWTGLISSRTQEIDILITEDTRPDLMLSFAHPYEAAIAVTFTAADNAINSTVYLNITDNDGFVASLGIKQLHCVFASDFVNVGSLALGQGTEIEGSWQEKCPAHWLLAHYTLFSLIDRFRGDENKTIFVSFGVDLEKVSLFYDEKLIINFVVGGMDFSIDMTGFNALFGVMSSSQNITMSISGTPSPDFRFFSFPIVCVNDTVMMTVDKEWENFDNQAVAVAISGELIMNTYSKKIPIGVLDANKIIISQKENVSSFEMVSVDVRSAGSLLEIRSEDVPPKAAANHVIQALTFRGKNPSFEIRVNGAKDTQCNVKDVLVEENVSALVTSATITKTITLRPGSSLDMDNTVFSNTTITLVCELEKPFPKINLKKDTPPFQPPPSSLQVSFVNSEATLANDLGISNLVCGMTVDSCNIWTPWVQFGNSPVKVNNIAYNFQVDCAKIDDFVCLQLIPTVIKNWRMTGSEAAVLATGIVGLISLVVSGYFIMRLLRGYYQIVKERETDFGL